MPTASQCVGVSPDGQYICATGTYKPRLKCFDTAQMSLKFERGLDSDVVNFTFLGEDYGKIVFLQCDRYIELHSQFGRYYRLRIPKYGRDMAYHFPSCDLFVGGIGSVSWSSNERLNVVNQSFYDVARKPIPLYEAFVVIRQ